MSKLLLGLVFFVGVTSQALDLGQRAQDIFEAKCAKCHGPGSPGNGGLSQILDFQYLIDSPKQYIVPGKPDDSLIYFQIDNDLMPYQSPPLSSDEKAQIRDWIVAGAPLPAANNVKRLSPDDVVALIKQDLGGLPTAHWKFQRYFSFVHLQNIGLSSARLATFQQGLNKLLNFLSTANDIYLPTPVKGASAALFRIDMRALNWNDAKWAALESAYPYFIQQPIYESLQKNLETKIPVVQADWFAKFASIEPLYSALLGHPDTSTALEKSLGINLAGNEKDFVARRAGFSDSGVALHNRVIERHPIKTYPGYYWISFDFSSSFGGKDIRANPFGPLAAFEDEKAFIHDGGEIIYQLPNGLHGYMLVNAKTNRLAEAPINIVRDTDPRRPVITNGISCMSCHSQGLKDKNFDIVYDNAVQSGAFSASSLKKMRALYAGETELKKLYSDDNQSFSAALKKAKVDLVDDNVEQVNQVSYDFDGALRLDRAAETLGLASNELKQKLSQNPALCQLLAQFQGTGVPRENFIKTFSLLVKALKLGEALNGSNLQELLDNALSGSTVVIPAGLYYGAFTIKNKSVNLVAENNATVEVQGLFKVVNTIMKTVRVTMTGFTFIADDSVGNEILQRPYVDAGPGFHLDLNNMHVTSVLNGPYYHFSSLAFLNRDSSVRVTDSHIERLGNPFICNMIFDDLNGACYIEMTNSTVNDVVDAFTIYGSNTRLAVRGSAFSNIHQVVTGGRLAEGFIEDSTFENILLHIVFATDDTLKVFVKPKP